MSIKRSVHCSYQMKIKYHGPDIIRPLAMNALKDSYAIVSRKGRANYIVGNISEIIPQGSGYKINPDIESNENIDAALAEVMKNTGSSRNRIITDLQQSYTDISQDIMSYYDPIFDYVRFAPNVLASLTAFMMLESVSEAEAKKYHEKNNQDFRLLKHISTHEMLHWDFGDTKYCTSLRKMARHAGLSYASVKGEYCISLVKNADFSQEYYTDFLQHEIKQHMLGIHDFVEAAVRICSIAVSEPPDREKELEKISQDLFNKVISHWQKGRPSDFISFAKKAVDDAYMRNIHIEELL